MGLLECASGASLWRGYDYFKANKVLSIKKSDENSFYAEVSGNSDKPYSVELHIDHPRKSKCSCPHADGKRIICKHMIAVYFTAHPNEAEKFYEETIAYQEEEEQREEELYDKVCHYVWKMKKDEAQQALLELLFDGPEWQFNRFVEEHWLKTER